MFPFKSTPLLKIIFPYLIGIFYVVNFSVFPQLFFIFFLSSSLVIVTFLINHFSKQKTKFKKVSYIISINIFLFSLAHVSFYFYNSKNNKEHYTHYMYSNQQPLIGVVSEVPVFTDKGMRLVINVNEIKYENKWLPVDGKTIIYLKKDSVLNYNVGDFLFIKSKWSYIPESKNPNEFNYKLYLENKNIFNVIYAQQNQVFKIKNIDSGFSIVLIGEKIKSKTVEALRKSNLSENAISICSALLVGFDDEIDKDVLTSFSHSGTLHILSVSGMHTGVICGIILFLFSLFDKEDKFKKTKCAVIISILILFTTVTGFSPSVLRASVMMSLIILGKTFQKQSNSYNTLLLSAFILLLINPLLIIDVGFLLSYFAVFGIMYLYPILNQTFYTDNKLLKWFWSSCLISLSATIFTLPITLYYFHQFPIWFMFSNLIIIPISLGVMFFAFLIVLLQPVLFLMPILSKITNSLIFVMIKTSNFTDNSRFGYIDTISFEKIDVVFLSLVIIYCLIFIKHKYYKYGFILFSICITWILLNIFQNYLTIKENEIVIFHINKKSFFGTRIGNDFYCNTDSLSSSEFNRFVKPYLLKYNHTNIHHINQNCIKFNNVSIVNITRSTQSKITTSVNYVLISNNSYVNLSSFDFSKTLIIADCSNNYKTIKKIKKQCAKNHLQFYDVKEKGALVLNIE